MLLTTIFDSLTYGELKQMSLGGRDEGGIYPTYAAEVLTHLNMGLIDLYTKFPLKLRELKLETQMGKTIYALESKFAVSANHAEPYIIDTVEDPFTDDILRLDAVYDSDGCVLRVNDESSPTSVHLPAYNQVQIPYAQGLEKFYFIYRATPSPVVILPEETPADIDVAIPTILLEPLLTYIASRANTARGGDSGIQEGIIAMQQYEQMCRAIEEKNVFNNSQINSNLKLENNGWV